MIFNRIGRLVNLCWETAVAASLFASLSTPAAAAVGDWVGGDNARVRLLAAGLDADGRLSAGIEIALAPGWKTYWRSPGDAGVAPVADFSASANIALPVEIAFPVPRRHDDGYAVINVYEDRVVLLASAKVADPARPVRLALGLDIGVCEEICVPEHYDLTLDLAAGESDAEAAAILAEARAGLPGAPVPGAFAAESVVRAGGTDKRPVFAFAVVAPAAPAAELFVEGPPDWFPGLPVLVSAVGDRAVFSVEFSRLGAKTPVGGNAFTVTVVSAGRAIVDTVTLD